MVRGCWSSVGMRIQPLVGVALPGSTAQDEEGGLSTCVVLQVDDDVESRGMVPEDGGVVEWSRSGVEVEARENASGKICCAGRVAEE
jgi:hypothetical protein